MAAPTSVVSHGPWGGPGGDSWKYQTSNGITRIIMQVGVNVKSICFTDSTGKTSQVFGALDPAYQGQQKTVSINWPKEYLKSINGTHGKFKGIPVIISLMFTTNLGTYGPFGRVSGTPFSHPFVHDDHAIVGFYGRFGYYLDSIGTFVAPRLEKPPVSIGPAVEKPPVSIGPAGGQGGSTWSYVTSTGIKKILLNFGPIISALTFEDATGAKSAQFGLNRGRIQGTVSIDWPSEYLTSISGSYGNFYDLTVITSISFTTNKKTYGTNGTRGHGNRDFSFSSPNNMIAGFHGKAGNHIDSIGIFVAPRLEKPPLSIVPAVEKPPVSIGPAGGQGGSKWSYVTNKGIKKILLNFGPILTALTFEDSTGANSAQFGQNRGQNQETVHIGWPSEYLTSITGSYAMSSLLSVINSISFTTNKKTFGPYGVRLHGNKDFSFSSPNNMIVGFHGNAGYHIDSIGIFVKPI